MFFLKESLLDRRGFITGMAGAAVSAGLAPRLSFGSESNRPPNVILFIADNLGWRDLGCCGDPNAISPNLDRMAGNGVRFTNAFVTASSCSPSRSSIASGQSPHSVGTLGLTHLNPKFQMPTDTPTIADVMKRRGHTTAIDGKWHIAPFKPVKKYGYDSHLNMYEITESDQAKKYISQNRDRPFFLEMNFMQTHRPVMGGKGKEFFQHEDFPIDPETIEIQDYWNLPDWPEIKKDVAGYYSQAAAMDAVIGEVMDHLEDEGLAENTLAVFVSDNGPMYPGGIGTCHDRGIATPLIISWPGVLPAGNVSDGLVSTIDIMPTCAEAVGSGLPPGVQGKSLMPVMKGETASVNDAIFAEMTHHVKYTPMRAIRTKNFKYIENLNDEPVGLDMCDDFDWAVKVAELPDQTCCVKRPPEELYDLESDPNEMNNLAGDPGFAEKKNELREKLHAWRSRTGDPLIEG